MIESFVLAFYHITSEVDFVDFVSLHHLAGKETSAHPDYPFPKPQATEETY